MLFNSVFTIFWDFNIQCRVCYTACSVNRRETVSLFKFPIKSLMIPFELNWPVSLITIYILYVIITQQRNKTPQINLLAILNLVVHNGSVQNIHRKDCWTLFNRYNLTSSVKLYLAQLVRGDSWRFWLLERAQYSWQQTNINNKWAWKEMNKGKRKQIKIYDGKGKTVER